MTRLTLRAFASALIALGTPAIGGVVTTFTASSGDWSTPGNWDSGVPAANDRAVIPAGHTCIIGNSTATAAYADTIEVQTGGGGPGTLEIHYDSSLTLYNAVDNISPTGADNSLIDGSVVLDASSTAGADLIFQGDHILTGSGRVRGVLADVLPKIRIGPWKLMTNQIYSSDGSAGIIGSLRITGTGAPTPATPHFKNDEGTVSAGYNGEHDHHIIIDSGMGIDDSSGALWYINSCKGFLTFDSGSTALSGDFKMSHSGPGTLEINQDVSTCGTFEFVGVLSVDTGHLFGYRTFLQFSSCTNPGTYSGTLSCANPYLTSGDHSCTVCGE